MLSAHCPVHGRDVFIPTSRIQGIENGDRAMVVRWRCSCGTVGTTSFPRRRPAV
jgi:hypothetical protein